MREDSYKIIKGATALGIGAFLAKLLGAIYRIPLTNLIGGLGLGLYQMVFPVYCVLLDFSGAGVPQALSKLIAPINEEDKPLIAKEYLITALKLLSVIGIICTILMIVFCRALSNLQGDGNAIYAYLALAPAVLLVALLSCFRGYFQGHLKMAPTAISQVIEQIVKLVLGLFFVKLFLPSIPKAVGGATLAISISEFCALIYLVVVYKKHVKKNQIPTTLINKNFLSVAKKIIKVTVPITLIGIIIPFSQVIDSFIIINLLSIYAENATSLYGLLSGVASTVINLPVSICYGIATVAIPIISRANKENDKNKNALKTIVLTLLVSIPSTLFLAVASPFTVKVLFSGLSNIERPIAENLIRICSPCVVLLSLLQTLNAILIAKGKLYFPIISLTSGVIVKIIVSLILLRNPFYNVYGGAIALIACYFTVCLINLIMIFKFKVKHADKRACNRQYAS